MPIRPENRVRYPENWKEIRASIIKRAGNVCEFCGVPNHTMRLNPKTGKEVKIVLTIAHLDHTPENNDPENLRALCQRCHNQHDAQHRAETRKARVGQKQEQKPEPFAIPGESEERAFHRFTCPNRGYEGSCLELSGRTALGHALVACREDAPCSRLKEYDEHGLEEYVDPEERTMWECRRYEIAKEVLPTMIHICCGNYKIAAKESVECADILIEELNNINQQQTNPEPTMTNKATLADGVYFITEDANGNRSYSQLTAETTTAPASTKYIGIKAGCRQIAVALEDLPGDADGELQLIPYAKNKCPRTNEHYSYDTEKDEYRFNAFEDFDGENNTARLLQNGCEIELPEGEWIPSLGELGVLMNHATELNRALQLAGGKPIKGWHWSSTEYSATGAWFVNFSSGYVNYNVKTYSGAVRAVAAF